MNFEKVSCFEKIVAMGYIFQSFKYGVRKGSANIFCDPLFALFDMH